MKTYSFLARAAVIASLAFGFTASAIPVWINEIHYDNNGSDLNEFVEIAGVAGTSLSGYSILLYNGSGGAVYGTISLSGTIGNQQHGFGTLSFPAAGIQNGSPDGLALVGPGSSIIQFLSYEGTFTAVGGAANGMTSVDIGVLEPETTPAGRSLQLTGAGNSYEHFLWSSPVTATAGGINTGQSFAVPDGGSMFVLLALSVSILFLARRVQGICVPARRRLHRRPSLHR